MPSSSAAFLRLSNSCGKSICMQVDFKERSHKTGKVEANGRGAADYTPFHASPSPALQQTL